MRSGALAVVAIDSVAALTPKAEIEGEMGDSHVGLQARLMSQALRKLAGTLNRTDTICLFTNQLREKIGVMFGNPETTPGGRALRFYASVRLDIRRIETLKDGVEAFGNRVRVKVVKNKVAPPFKQAEFDIIYGEGISWEGTVLDAGLERKIVQKSGSYFSFGDERLGQGRQNATAFLREHPDVVQGILQAIQAQAPPEQVVSARLLPTAEQAEAPPETPRSTRWRPRRPRAGRPCPEGATRSSSPRARSSTAIARGTSSTRRLDEAGIAEPRSASGRSRRSSGSATSTTGGSPRPGRGRSPSAATGTRRSALDLDREGVTAETADAAPARPRARARACADARARGSAAAGTPPSSSFAAASIRTSVEAALGADVAPGST